VTAESSVIELYMATKHEALLILDGRPLADLAFGDTVRIERGEHVFRLISVGTTNFYEGFRSKFNFRIRPDAVPSRESGPTHARETAKAVPLEGP
jgi:NAD+ kinase